MTPQKGDENVSNVTGTVTFEEWVASFSSVEAKQAVDAVGCMILTFRKPSSANEISPVVEQLVSQAESIAEMLKAQSISSNENSKGRNLSTKNEEEDSEWITWPGIQLIVAMPNEDTNENDPDIKLDEEDLDDRLRPYGFEYIDFVAKGKNSYDELTGVPRIREALEAYSWTTASGSQSDDDDEVRREDYVIFNSDGEEDGIEEDLKEMQLEMAALRFAMEGDSSRQQVEDSITEEDIDGLTN